MNYDYVKVACATPKIKVADVAFNAEAIKKIIDEYTNKDIRVLVFPELCLTGYTCGDLFSQKTLLKAAKQALFDLTDYTLGLNMTIVVGLPFEYENKLYNVAAVLCDGEILGIVPKSNIPNYSEFYEMRHFTPGFRKCVDIKLGDSEVPFGTDLIFKACDIDNFYLAVEICEDLWVTIPPSCRHAMAGATLIANVSASDENTGKDIYRKELVKSQSARLICGYMYADAGEGESTTDLVFAGHNMIAENGTVLIESKRFNNECVVAEIDLGRISSERRRMNTFINTDDEDYCVVEYNMHNQRDIEESFERYIDKAPFVPANSEDRAKRCDEILNIQAYGLVKRIEHTNAKNAVVGISGGLDSTLALLVTVRAFDILGLDHKGIIAVTMPGFGTTDRTYNNAVKLIERLGATFKEISIVPAVRQHFNDIGQAEEKHDLTYENSQARERTMLLMDIACKEGGFVVGTGDMSELALGWATYNGDHMSMYGVNASVPKSLVRHLVLYYADSHSDEQLKKVLYDVLDTPVSPELLPPQNGQISQKTEDNVGPYELHDFFLYNILRFGYEPSKIFFMARKAFAGTYEAAVIKKWLLVFYKRFFAQQFKRSCLPDGPKVGSVAVSPRGDLRMPSDACVKIWIDELEKEHE